MSFPRRLDLIPQAYDPDWTDLEGGVFNDAPGGGADGTSAGPPPPPIPVAASPSPNGVVAWSNPNSASGKPIIFTAAVSGFNSIAVPLLTNNRRRNLLILQNLSNSTATGDFAPILYFEWGRPAIVGQSIALQPGAGAGQVGEGIVLDYVCPRDPLYVVFGPYNNTGGSVVISGAVQEGIHSPDQSYQLGQPVQGYVGGTSARNPSGG